MNTESGPLLVGSCLCGVVKYEARSRARAVSHCHCGMCRKAHGAAFGTYASVPMGDFAVVAGAEAVRSRDSSPGVTRTFCSLCGSPLTWHSTHGEAAGWISFSLGTLDTPFMPAKQRHVHQDCAAPWHVAEGAGQG